MHGDMLRDPAMGGMVQHMNLTPLYTKVRFGMWDEVLAEPAPPADLPFMTAMWHAARGLAHAAQGRLDEAETERAAVAALKDDPSLKTLYVSSVNVASAIVGDRATKCSRARSKRGSAAPIRRRGTSRRRWRSRTGSPTWSRPTGRFPSASCRARRCWSSGARRRPRRRSATT